MRLFKRNQAMYNKVKLIFLVLALMGIFTGCSKSNASQSEVKKYEKQIFSMGTIIDVSIYDTNDEKVKEAVEKIEEKIFEIEQKMSVNIETSEISKLNNSLNEDIKLSEETFYVLKKAMNYSKLSKGRFDVTVLKLVEEWGIGTEKAKIPKQEKIDEILKHVNYENVKLDGSKLTARKLNSQMGIDLGAIAKGYLGDEISKILDEYEIKSAFVNIGGNVMLKGRKPNNKLWRIGVQNPLEDRGDYLGIYSAEDVSIVTSGDYERYFEENNVRYHHILNAKTGYPSRSDVKSSTIISKTGIDADALSTIVYILGSKEGIKLINSIEDVECIVVTENREIIKSENVSNFELRDKSFEVK